MAVGIRFKVDERIKGTFLKEPERVIPIYDREFRKAMNESVSLVQREVVPRTPIQSGIGRKSIGTEVRGSGLNLEGVIGTPLVYMAPIERGVEPLRCFPPLAPIELWARRRGIDTIKGEPLPYTKIAFVVARGIYRSGIRARRMFENGFEASKGYVLKALNEAQGRVLRAMER